MAEKKEREGEGEGTESEGNEMGSWSLLQVAQTGFRLQVGRVDTAHRAMFLVVTVLSGACLAWIGMP